MSGCADLHLADADFAGDVGLGSDVDQRRALASVDVLEQAEHLRSVASAAQDDHRTSGDSRVSSRLQRIPLGAANGAGRLQQRVGVVASAARRAGDAMVEQNVEEVQEPDQRQQAEEEEEEADADHQRRHHGEVAGLLQADSARREEGREERSARSDGESLVSQLLAAAAAAAAAPWTRTREFGVSGDTKGKWAASRRVDSDTALRRALSARSERQQRRVSTGA